jgi:hypothetical protein
MNQTFKKLAIPRKPNSVDIGETVWALMLRHGQAGITSHKAFLNGLK